MSPTTPVMFAGQRFDADDEVVDLVNVRPVSLEPLSHLPQLRVLRLHHTNPHTTPGGPLLDLTALRHCAHLAVVDIPRQNVRALDGLEGHPQLQTIDVSGTRVDDLTPLTGLPRLTVLRVRHTRVARLAPLASLSALEQLDVAHTPIDDVAALRDLPALTTLDLRATRVTDLSVLAELPALRRVVVQRLDVDGNAVDGLRAARPDLDVVT